MKSFICIAALCFAAASVSADTTPASPVTPPSGGSPPLDPTVESAICGDKGLDKVCPAKGDADKVCKEIVAKVNGSDAKCHDVGVCSFTAPSPSANASAPGAPLPSGASPLPGGASPLPGGASPLPGGASPLPGSAAPAPGGASPTPGGAGPTPGAAGPHHTLYISKKSQVEGSHSIKKCEDGVSIFAPKLA